jgi:release factor glutamine methyltransferase
MAGSVHERIAAARAVLVRAGLPPDEAALDAEVLARHALGWDRAALLVRGREGLPAGFADAYAALVDRRAAREPVALITGHREFWGLDFFVTPDVLVPRPETELIVERAIARGRARAARWILDVGTGSGCLAVALAAELPGARVVATDLSAAALSVAAVNRRRHRLEDRLHLVRADGVDAMRGPFDLVVSNPPYVALGSGLPPEVERHEPHAALYAGRDGLDVLRPLIRSVASRLAPGGQFIVEFGFGQRDRVERLAQDAGWSRVTMVDDLQGIPRVAVLAADD